MPAHGVLTVDFVSMAGVCEDANIISDADLTALLRDQVGQVNMHAVRV